MDSSLPVLIHVVKTSYERRWKLTAMPLKNSAARVVIVRLLFLFVAFMPSVHSVQIIASSGPDVRNLWIETFFKPSEVHGLRWPGGGEGGRDSRLVLWEFESLPVVLLGAQFNPTSISGATSINVGESIKSAASLKYFETSFEGTSWKRGSHESLWPLFEHFSLSIQSSVLTITQHLGSLESSRQRLTRAEGKCERPLFGDSRSSSTTCN